MIQIQEQLGGLILKALKELDLPAGEAGIEVGDIHLEHPVDLSMGDYSTNIAMVYAKKLGQNPRELAEKIVEKITVTGALGKIEVAGAGFINFYLKPEFFANSVKEILEKGEKFGSNEKLKGKKVMVEYTDPNPFKEIHIGHLMSNAIGESISRIIGFSGADVIRANFQGDVGLHVAKAVFGIKDILLLKEGSDLPKDKDLNEQVNFLGRGYFLGAGGYKDVKGAEEKIKELNKKIYERSDQEINEIYDWGRKVSLDYFETIYKKLGTKFNDYFFESETGPVGQKIVEENTRPQRLSEAQPSDGGRGGKVFEESDGAIVFKGEDYGLHTRVFINSEGLPTYETKDLGLIKAKFEKHPDLDLSISITGNEVNEYFKVMLKAVELINPEWSEKTKHISHGMLRLPEGKMSSRTGDVITAESLIDKVEEIISKKNEDKKTAEKVSIGAIKYSILKSASGKDIIFDFNKSLSIEGNSGPYLQYTYARTNSILEKAKQENLKKWVPGTHQTEDISDVEKILYRFPEVVERAGDEYEPHYIATYLSELAQAFNSYYAVNKIVDKEDDSSSYKIALTKAVGQVIKNGLFLLGIETPERM